MQLRERTIRIVRYIPWAESDKDRLKPLRQIELPGHFGTIVSGAVALFGTVLEFENALVVLATDGAVSIIEGEPVNWRTFPRSVHYANQLHVVYDDRLEVYSFNHDYFVDQSEKVMGFAARDFR